MLFYNIFLRWPFLEHFQSSFFLSWFSEIPFGASDQDVTDHPTK